MSLWLTVSIWIMWAIWSVVEVHALYVRDINYCVFITQTSSMVTILWVLFTVFWFYFQFIS